MSLRFDEATHTYTWDGLVVPSVTTILKPLSGYGAIPAHILKAAADFGTAVHLACELDDLDLLDEDNLDPALMPYLQAWRKFSKDYAVAWDAIEEPTYQQTMRYAGTPDRFGMVQGLKTVVDIKTTQKLMPTVGPQLAAYAALVEPFAASSLGRMGVQLKGDGTYHAQIYADPGDWPLFVSLLTVRNWSARHSITPNFKD